MPTSDRGNAVRPQVRVRRSLRTMGPLGSPRPSPYAGRWGCAGRRFLARFEWGSALTPIHVDGLAGHLLSDSVDFGPPGIEKLPKLYGNAATVPQPPCALTASRQAPEWTGTPVSCRRDKPVLSRHPGPPGGPCYTALMIITEAHHGYKIAVRKLAKKREDTQEATSHLAYPAQSSQDRSHDENRLSIG